MGPPQGPKIAAGRLPSTRGGLNHPGRGARGQRNVRVAGAVHALHGPPAPQPKAPAKAAAPKSTPYVHYLGKTFGFSPAEGRGVEGLLNSAQQSRQNVEREPYQQKAKEIGNIEQTVQQRYGAATGQMNNLLQGLVNQSEGSAKTFENQAAENALNATRSVETAGQNALTSTGGYMNPELRAALQASGTGAENLAQGGVNRANELGQSNTNYMRQLAAAAAVGAGTGPGGGLANIANRYQTMQGQNLAKENEALNRSAARSKEERLTFPKELLTQKIGKEKFEKANEIAKAKIGATERGQTLTRQSAAERAKVTERGQNIAAETAKRGRELNARIQAGKLKVSELNAKDKATYDKWKMSQPGGAGEKPKEGRAYVGKVSSAIAQIQRYPHTAKGRAEARAFLAAGNKEEGISAYNNDVINAAMDVAEKGYFSPGSRKAAEAQGVNSKNVGHNWFR